MTTSATVLFARLAAKARLRHLQLIAAIGELGSLQKAGAAIGLSQPAATHALSELESTIGSPIFERHAKGMRPTAVGHALLPLVRNALRSVQECAQVAAAMGSGTTSMLRIGAIGAAISSLLCQALPRFSTQHPEVVVDVAQLTPEELLVQIVQRSLDLAICREPSVLPVGFEFVPVLADHYAVVASPRHPLAGKPKASLEDLGRQTWLMPPPSGIAGHDFHRLWEGFDRPPAVCWVTSRVPLLMWAMLAQRQLLAFVPYNTARQWIDAGLLVEIQGQWDVPLPPLGAVVRDSERTGRGPIASFVEELLCWTDLDKVA